MPKDGSPRILIARMSAIGDTILTTPVLNALRDHLPGAFIAWVVERGAAPVLRGHAGLDELIVLPRLWSLSPREVWRLRRRLRSLRFDITIDPQSINKTALACRLSGAPQRIGLAGTYGKELSPWLNNCRIQNEHPHIVDRSLELLVPLGITEPTARFDLPADAEAEAEIASWLAESDRSGDGDTLTDSDTLTGPAGFAVINPGASWDSKLWPADRYARVAEHLAAAHGVPTVVVWAGDRERAWADEICAAAGRARLAPRTSLTELCALLRRARLFVGSDTGPLHMAAATGTPCVSMYGTTRPEDCGPYGPQHVALQERYHGGTSRERRHADNSAMRLIRVEQVCHHCDRVLSARQVAGEKNRSRDEAA